MFSFFFSVKAATHIHTVHSDENDDDDHDDDDDQRYLLLYCLPGIGVGAAGLLSLRLVNQVPHHHHYHHQHHHHHHHLHHH